MTYAQLFFVAFQIWASVFGVIAAICVYAARSLEVKAAVTLVCMLAVDVVLNLAGALSVAIDAGALQFGNDAFWLAWLPQLVVRLCEFLFLIFTSQHIARIIVVRGGVDGRRLTATAIVIAAFGMATVVTTWVFGSFFAFDAQSGMAGQAPRHVQTVLAELALLPVLIQVIQNRHSIRRSEFTAFAISYMLLAAGFMLPPPFDACPCFVVSYALVLITIVMTHQMEFSKDNMERERRLARAQLQLYTRQIQPHFIYNSLSAIRTKLPVDSEARDSLNHFAGFLRGSVDLLTTENSVSAGKEFATVMDYLYMEKERFGDDLTIVTDIQDKDFELPPFTVQTLVENAIRCGIRENDDGRGTLTIKSRRTSNAHVIEVIDDGVGFDPLVVETKEDERNHIGLANVRERLRLMCKGTLSIESTPGKGTLVRVEIPVV